MSEKHTEGPWHTLEEGNEILIIGHASHLATVPIGCSSDEPSDRANAALIAAAPELLAALQKYMAADDAQSNGDEVRRMGPYAQASLAIAKAVQS